MKTISRYFFMLGGVILPRLSGLTLVWMEEKNARSCGDVLRQNIFQAEKDLFTGKFSPADYLAPASACVPGAGLQDILREMFLSIKVDEGAAAVARDLKKNGRVYLVSDYPKTWFEEAARKTAIFAYFAPEDVLYTADLGLNNDVSAVFDALDAKNYLHAQANMWVDAYPFRTSAAIRRGIDAIIYVDERRLRRELTLRNLLGN